MKNYLKQFGLNLYKIYDEIISTSEYEDGVEFFDLDDLKYIDEFENYLSLKMDEDRVDMHISNLSELIDSYFTVEAYDLDDLLGLDLDELLYSSIDNGLISLKGELMSHVKSLKLYFYFLTSIDPSFKDLYNWSLDISNNPFKYVKYLNSYGPDFKLDRNFAYYIKESLNGKALDLVKDFDIFILYIESKHMEATKTSNKIKRKDLFAINDSLENKTKPSTKAANQRHFINIDLFYNIAFDLGLFNIIDKNILPTDRAIDYLQLEKDEKYIILLQAISDTIFGNKKDYVFEAIYRRDLSFSINEDRLFLDYKHYLILLGLIKLDSKKDSLKISALAKAISSYLKANKNRDTNPVIDIIDYKK